MPQALIHLDIKEDKKIEYFSDKWKISKADTIIKIIREFKEAQ